MRRFSFLGVFLYLTTAGLLLGGCASAPSVQSPELAPQSVSGKRRAVIDNALAQVGTPYRYGGDNSNGFDCSGLVYFSFLRARIGIPRTTHAQRRAGTRVSLTGARPGDILFYRFGSKSANLHDGLYLGGGRMVHASTGAHRVKVVDMTKPWWTSRFLGAVSFLP
jgi:cell wall-associated NlpC family hydrolase